MFDLEHGMALHTRQGKWCSSCCEGEISQFSPVPQEPGIHSRVTAGMPIQNLFVQTRQDACLVMTDTSGTSTRLGRAIWTLLGVRRETESPFLVATVILVFLSIFNRSQSLLTFEALNSAYPRGVKVI